MAKTTAAQVSPPAPPPPDEPTTRMHTIKAVIVAVLGS
jgi:hypothetical protein